MSVEMTNRFILAAFVAAGFFALSHGPSLSAVADVPAFVKAAVADPHRPKSDTDRDSDRLPLEMLGFSGVKPGDTVAELIPAQGYSTRLLSAAVGPKGHIYAINLPTIIQRFKDQTKPLLADPNYSNVSYMEQDFSTLKLPEQVDAVWTAQNYHDFNNPGQDHADTDAMNRAIFAALKPGGLYLVIDHAAAAGAGKRDTQTLHRIDPAAVKAEVLAAGFEFVGESTALANANDPHTARVLGQAGIGDKTDKFYYKFRKPQ
jgi:predicted methyltransferase